MEKQTGVLHVAPILAINLSARGWLKLHIPIGAIPNGISVLRSNISACKIINSTNFIGNESENNYGAIFLNNIGIDYINISNCDIVGNKATSKAGVFVGNGDHVVINNCRIDSNIADGGSQAGLSINNNEKEK